MYVPISAWLPAFLATLAIEAPIIGFALRRVVERWVAAAVVFVFANLATHLAVWFLATQLLEPATVEFFLAAEAWAVAGETLLYWAAFPRLSPIRAAGAAAVANAVSAAAGLVMAAASGGVLPW